MNIFTKLKKGFTLAELMVVVAILAILAGAALGSYRKSMDKTQFTEGLRAAHALAAAVDEYFYEHIPNKYPTQMTQLRTGLSSTSAITADSITTKNFIYTLKASSSPISTSNVIGIHAQAQSGKFGIDVFLESAGALKDRCTFSSNSGKEMCESIGYGLCNDTDKYCE